MSIRPSRRSDLPIVLATLAEERLPGAGVAEHFEAFLVAEQGGRVIGAVGFERYAPHGLLRSVVVAPDRRGEGVGDALLAAMVARCRGEGLTELWLLTEAAGPWFRARGFASSDRADAPSALAASEQFQILCPESAACLVLHLEPDRDTS